MNNAQRAKRDPQLFFQGDTLAGLYKGIVEDVSDGLGLGRARIRVYSVHGDAEECPIESIPWAEPVHTAPGSFLPPEIYDQVWVTFENGNKNCPIYLTGNWHAVPVGDGVLPNSRRQGTTVPREARIYGPTHYPMAASLFRSGEGDQIWVEDVEFAKAFYSKMSVMDNAGKSLKISTSRIPNPGGRSRDYDPEGGNAKGGWDGETVYRNKDHSEIRSNVFDDGYIALADSVSKVKLSKTLGLNWAGLYSVKDNNAAALQLENGKSVTQLSGDFTNLPDYSYTREDTSLETSLFVSLSTPLTLPEAW